METAAPPTEAQEQIGDVQQPENAFNLCDNANVNAPPTTTAAPTSEMAPPQANTTQENNVQPAALPENQDQQQQQQQQQPVSGGVALQIESPQSTGNQTNETWY